LKQVAALIYSNRQADVDPHQLTLVNVVWRFFLLVP
jgi:hypothetical protein